MSLESILKPAKWADEQVLRQYTKVSQMFHLDEGKRKYKVGLSFWISHVLLCGLASLPLKLMTSILNASDFCYNMHGISGEIKDELSSEPIAINKWLYRDRKINSISRFPTFLLGGGLVGKFGVNLYNNITQGESLTIDDYFCLTYGLGLISLASSMYIKESDPKLLQKDPFWKKAYNWLKEKAGNLAPAPVPNPAPVQYQGLEECL